MWIDGLNVYFTVHQQIKVISAEEKLSAYFHSVRIMFNVEPTWSGLHFNKAS